MAIFSEENIEETEEAVNNFTPEPKDDSGKFDPSIYKFLNTWIPVQLKKGDPSGPDDYRKGPILFSTQTFAIVSRLDTIVSILTDIKKGKGGGEPKESSDDKKMKKNKKEALDTLKMFGSIGLLIVGFAAFVFVTGLAGQIKPNEILNAMAVIGLFYAVVVPMVLLASLLSPFASAFIPFAIAVALLSATLLIFAFGIKMVNKYVTPKDAQQFTETMSTLAKSIAADIGWYLLGAVAGLLLAVFAAALAVASVVMLITALALIRFSKLWNEEGLQAYRTITALPLLICGDIGWFLLGAVAALLLAVFGVAMMVATVTLTVSVLALWAFNLAYGKALGAVTSQDGLEKYGVLADIMKMVSPLTSPLLMIELTVAVASAALLRVVGILMTVATITFLASAGAIAGIGAIASLPTFEVGLNAIPKMIKLDTGLGFFGTAKAIAKWATLALIGMQMAVAAVSMAIAAKAMETIKPEGIPKFKEAIHEVVKLSQSFEKDELKKAEKSLKPLTSIAKTMMFSSVYILVAFKSLKAASEYMSNEMIEQEFFGTKMKFSKLMGPFYAVAEFAKNLSAKNGLFKDLSSKSMNTFLDISKDFSKASDNLREGFKNLDKIDDSAVTRFSTSMITILDTFKSVNELCKDGSVSRFKENIENISSAAIAAANLEDALKAIPSGDASTSLTAGVTNFINYIQTNLSKLIDLAKGTEKAWNEITKTAGNTASTSSALKAMNDLLTPLSGIVSAVKTIFDNVKSANLTSSSFEGFYEALLGRNGLWGDIVDWFAGDNSIVGMLVNIIKLFDLKKGKFTKILQKDGLTVTSIQDVTSGVASVISEFKSILDNVKGLAEKVNEIAVACGGYGYADPNNESVKALTSFVDTIIPKIATAFKSMEGVETPKNLADITKFTSSVVSLSNVPAEAGEAITRYGDSVSKMVSAFNSKGIGDAAGSLKTIFNVDVNQLNYLSQMINLLRIDGTAKAEFESFSNSMNQIAESLENVNNQTGKASVEGLEKFVGNLQKVQETGPITITLEIKDTQEQIKNIAKDTKEMNENLKAIKGFIENISKWPKNTDKGGKAEFAIAK